jgi:hypothetical protein
MNDEKDAKIMAWDLLGSRNATCASTRWRLGGGTPGSNERVEESEQSSKYE